MYRQILIDSLVIIPFTFWLLDDIPRISFNKVGNTVVSYTINAEVYRSSEQSMLTIGNLEYKKLQKNIVPKERYNSRWDMAQTWRWCSLGTILTRIHQTCWIRQTINLLTTIMGCGYHQSIISSTHYSILTILIIRTQYFKILKIHTANHLYPYHR